MPDTLERTMREFWIARAAVLVTAALNAVLINHLTIFPWWLASVLEVVLLVPLSIATAWNHRQQRRASGEHGWLRIRRNRRLIRRAAILLTAVITLINFQALFAVLHALLYGARGTTGQSLLVDALNIWLTNVVVFALWFWNLDRGTAAAGLATSGRMPDLLFPQMTAAFPQGEQWSPGFVDYVFVSFTNATAFSPADAVPLTPRAKLLFMVQAAASLLTVGLVAARAVNILA